MISSTASRIGLGGMLKFWFAGGCKFELSRLILLPSKHPYQQTRYTCSSQLSINILRGALLVYLYLISGLNNCEIYSLWQQHQNNPEMCPIHCCRQKNKDVASYGLSRELENKFPSPFHENK